jgi:hypothetical protein
LTAALFDQVDRAALGRQRGQRLERLALQADQRDRRAGPEQLARQRLAEAAAGTGEHEVGEAG